MTRLFLSRLRAAGLHFLVSLAAAVVVAVLVLQVWFPTPFGTVSGGRELFYLVVSVDVVLGPLLTFAVFNPAKPRKWLKFDLGIIGVVQMVALAYGVHTCFLARPVAMVFEKDRFRVVTAVEVYEPDLKNASPQYQRLSWTGPVHVATRPATEAERFDAIALASQGYDVGQRPSFWVPYESHLPQVLRQGRSIEAVARQCPAQRGALEAARGDRADTAVRILPMIARQLDWAVMLDTGGKVLGFVPCDVFSVPRPDRSPD